jgi:hypothetical protein
MARLKIKKTDEYEVHDIYKEFLVTVGKQEFKILKKNRTIRVLKKIDRDGETPTYTELKGKEIGDLLKRLKPSTARGRVSAHPPSHLPFHPPHLNPVIVPMNTIHVSDILLDSDSPEDDIIDSGFDDESTRVLYESEYNDLLAGLDDTEYVDGQG